MVYLYNNFMTNKKTYLILFNLPLMPNLDLALLLETYSQTITSNILVDEASKGSFVFYFTLGLALVFLGFFGLAFLRTNIISLLLSIELMLLGLSFCFILAYVHDPFPTSYTLYTTGEPIGLILALVFIAIAAAESVIGLALIILVFQQFRSLDITNFCLLRG